MRYAAGSVPFTSVVPAGSEFSLPNWRQAVERFASFHRDPQAAFQQVQAALFAPDGSRVFNLLEECRVRHGRLARERTFQALHWWRSGGAATGAESLEPWRGAALMFPRLYSPILHRSLPFSFSVLGFLLTLAFE